MPSLRSCANVRLLPTETYLLEADCGSLGGQVRKCQLDLRDILSNDDGTFTWVPEDGNFHLTARKIYLSDGHVLHAELERTDRSWKAAKIDLSECIVNEFGDLVYQGGFLTCNPFGLSFVFLSQMIGDVDFATLSHHTTPIHFYVTFLDNYPFRSSSCTNATQIPYSGFTK
ncbi:hypothetical protein FRC03_010985 [Tulasnella sp. 419]|nr:hypothetical protein FRC03_010985 [Tulasnella sp. 419]